MSFAFNFFIFIQLLIIPILSFSNTLNYSIDKFPLDSIQTNYSIKKITIIGNDKTKYKIILRELLFDENEIIDSISLEERIKKSRINLLNKPLFNYVNISYVKSIDNSVTVYVIVVRGISDVSCDDDVNPAGLDDHV